MNFCFIVLCKLRDQYRVCQFLGKNKSGINCRKDYIIIKYFIRIKDINMFILREKYLQEINNRR